LPLVALQGAGAAAGVLAGAVIGGAKKTPIHGHLDHRVNRPVPCGGADSRKWLAGTKEIAKYL